MPEQDGITLLLGSSRFKRGPPSTVPVDQDQLKASHREVEPGRKASPNFAGVVVAVDGSQRRVPLEVLRHFRLREVTKV